MSWWLVEVGRENAESVESSKGCKSDASSINSSRSVIDHLFFEKIYRLVFVLKNNDTIYEVGIATQIRK